MTFVRELELVNRTSTNFTVCAHMGGCAVGFLASSFGTRSCATSGCHFGCKCILSCFCPPALSCKSQGKVVMGCDWRRSRELRRTHPQTCTFEKHLCQYSQLLPGLLVVAFTTTCNDFAMSCTYTCVQQTYCCSSGYYWIRPL